MVRDTLALKGPKSLLELKVDLSADSNTIMTLLLDLQSNSIVQYSLDKGTWSTEVVL